MHPHYGFPLRGTDAFHAPLLTIQLLQNIKKMITGYIVFYKSLT